MTGRTGAIHSEGIWTWAGIEVLSREIQLFMEFQQKALKLKDAFIQNHSSLHSLSLLCEVELLGQLVQKSMVHSNQRKINWVSSKLKKFVLQKMPSRKCKELERSIPA